uniref:CSON004080 protein n=1 Tax=Culicoides sonorensis TaxID=179676 RepID=A0A336LT33_CULSO
MVFNKIKREIKTFVCFWVLVIFSPFLITSFIVTSLWHRLWIRLLANRYGHKYEFCHRNTIRTLMDTFRNQGIFNFVVKVQGEIRPDAIRIKFQENVIEKKDKQGNACYPKMKLKLTTCWGNYAWIKNSSFNIDDHLVFAPPSFRGRMISETNIQDYLSNIVSKYLPADVPQWQMFVIPVMQPSGQKSQNVASTSKEQFSDSQNQYYYILLRIHHLLLDEENLCVKDLLCLVDEKNPSASIQNLDPKHHKNSLIDIVEPLVHIPKLYNTILACIVNRWNEFRYCFDPVLTENQSGNKNNNAENALQLIAVLVIISVTVIQKFYKGFHAVQDNLLIRTKYFQRVLKEECAKRNLSWEMISNAMAVTQVIRDIAKFWAWITLTFALTFPYKCLVELIAVIQFVSNGKPTRKSTFFSIFFEYIPLTTAAFKEGFYVFYSIYSAPMLIFQELFQRNKFCNIHSLQKVSLCGRKVISWSDKINIKELEHFQNQSHHEEIEIILAAISSSLHDFFTKINKNVAPPQQIDIGFTSINDQHLTGPSPINSDKTGMICLSLPLQNNNFNGNPVIRNQKLKKIRNVIEKLHETQLPNYILSKYNRQYDLFTNAIPKVVMRIFINYLSRKYPLIVTQVIDSNQHETEDAELKTLWGDKRFKGSHIRLAIVADALLSSNHGSISKGFKRHIDSIITDIK